MAAVDAPVLEKTQPPAAPEHADSFSSEKEKGGGKEKPTVEVVGDDLGEVFDDVRDIDLDENGKERPIGESRS